MLGAGDLSALATGGVDTCLLRSFLFPPTANRWAIKVYPPFPLPVALIRARCSPEWRGRRDFAALCQGFAYYLA